MRFLIFVQFIQSQTQSRHKRHTAQHRGNGHFRRFEKTVEPRFGCEIWIGKVDTIYVHASRCFRLRLASVPMHFVVHKSAHAGASALRMHFPPSLFAVAVPKTTDALAPPSPPPPPVLCVTRYVRLEQKEGASGSVAGHHKLSDQNASRV